MEPNHALDPKQSFAILSGAVAQQSTTKVPEDVTSFDLRSAQGLHLSQSLPEPIHKFMIYSVVEVLDHNHGIPKGVVNRTSWEPQALPLLAMKRDDWDQNQLVPWTGPEVGWVELTINNIDGTGHPFHLVSLNAGRKDRADQAG